MRPKFACLISHHVAKLRWRGGVLGAMIHASAWDGTQHSGMACMQRPVGPRTPSANVQREFRFPTKIQKTARYAFKLQPRKFLAGLVPQRPRVCHTRASTGLFFQWHLNLNLTTTHFALCAGAEYREASADVNARLQIPRQTTWAASSNVGKSSVINHSLQWH